MEADSLNASILGEDAVPGTPEFDLFINQARSEITVKCGQKCTAIRRIIVPENLMDDIQFVLGKALDKVIIGDPRLKEVRMGSLVSMSQVQEVKDRANEIAKTAKIVYGDFDILNLVGADDPGSDVDRTSSTEGARVRSIGPLAPSFNSLQRI